MPTLRELQQAFSTALTTGDGNAAEFVVPDGVVPDARLNIYRNTYVGNLVGALRISYPAVRKLVGDEFFEGACRLFIETHPSKSAYLNEYGHAFPDFLAKLVPAESLPYLAGVARLEWAVNVALHAEDAPILDAARLASLAANADPAFVAHPSVSLVAAEHPVDAIWRAVIEDDDAALAAIDLAQGAAFLVVNRGEHGILVARLSEDEWRFAQSLFAGVTLSRALATVSTDMSPSLAAHLAAGRFTYVYERTET